MRAAKAKEAAWRECADELDRTGQIGDAWTAGEIRTQLDRVSVEVDLTLVLTERQYELMKRAQERLAYRKRLEQVRREREMARNGS